MAIYWRPLPSSDPARPRGAMTLAGGWLWFDRIEVLERGRGAQVVAAHEAPPEVIARLTEPRATMAGLSWDRPRLMGILNITPDSFSDGGRFDRPEAAHEQARNLAKGADILDIGGESTRPGAADVPCDQEIARTVPVIAALRANGMTLPISIDTRKAQVASAALHAGANMVNDVAGLTHDPALGPLVAQRGVPVCLMHAQGTPQTMQASPQYDDVLLDVYDWLSARIAATEALGVPRSRIMVDPGIGFGKTLDHNLALLRRLSLFHALGCVVLLGVSRKRFIGTIGGADQPDERLPGTLALTMAGIAQGAQLHRVHDIPEARQALALWQAATGGTA